HAVTGSTAAVQAAVNTWATVAGSGCDAPEAQLYALDELATDPAISWRSDSSKIVVWFGDAPGHDPSNGISLSQAITDLNAAGIRVIAIDLHNTAEHTSLDDSGQATAITAATKGVLEDTSDPSAVATAIQTGL